MSSSTLTSVQKGPFQDKAIQTVIKVYPFILLPNKSRASVTSDKKFCTVLSLEASQNSSKFYGLLQYCPYRDIEEHSIRVINLPRKTKLQWNINHRFNENNLRALTLEDDDAIAEICNELLTRMRTGNKVTYAEAETQTLLTVRPFLLEDPKVAVVYRSIDIQVTSSSTPCHTSTNHTQTLWSRFIS